MREKDLLVQKVVEGLQEKKGKKIVVADMTHIEEAAFQYFVICEGTSSTHVYSIADAMIDYMREEAESKPYAYDGFQNSEWIAVDYGNILVHVFQPHVREFYKLEQLWADAQLTEIPDLD